MGVWGTNGRAARYLGVDKRWKHIEIDKRPWQQPLPGLFGVLAGVRDQIGRVAATILIVYGAGASFLPSGVV